MGVRVVVNEELWVIVKMQKKVRGEGVRVCEGGGVRGWSGERLVGSKVGSRGDIGYGVCEPRTEGIVQCT